MPCRKSGRQRKLTQRAVEVLDVNIDPALMPAQPSESAASTPASQSFPINWSFLSRKTPTKKPTRVEGQAQTSARPKALVTRKTPAKRQSNTPRKDSVRPEPEQHEKTSALPISALNQENGHSSEAQEEAQRFTIIDDDEYVGEVTFNAENEKEWQDARDFFYWVMCQRSDFDVSEALRKICNGGFVFHGDVLWDMDRYEAGQAGFVQVFFDLYGILPSVSKEMAYQHYTVIVINEEEINAHATMMAFDITCGAPSTRPECVIKASLHFHQMLHYQIQLRIDEENGLGEDKYEHKFEQSRKDFWVQWHAWDKKYKQYRGRCADARFDCV